MKYAKRMLSLTLIALPIMAVAQMGSSTRIEAQVPFPFMVGTNHVPAGKCTIERAGAGDRILAIRNDAGNVNMFTPAAPNLAKKTSGSYALVFNKYGDHAFLTGIKLAGDRTVYQIPQSRVETELRAQNATAIEEVLIAFAK